jgi:hypothetical protein
MVGEREVYEVKKHDEKNKLEETLHSLILDGDRDIEESRDIDIDTNRGRNADRDREVISR